MSKVGKIFLWVSLFGFVIVGLFLLTNHWGIATKIGNNLYYLLIVGVLYEVIKK